MSQPTRRPRRLSRTTDPLEPADWRWTRHAVQRMAERWPRLDRPELEATLGRATVLRRRAARCDLLVILPDHGLVICVVDRGAVVKGYPADDRR